MQKSASCALLLLQGVVEMLIKPILPSMAVYDATLDNRVSFVVIGGDLFSEYQIEITSINDEGVRIERTVVTSSTTISLEKGLLTNGAEYKMRVRTGNLTEQSEFSDYMVLKCYTTAQVIITNITSENHINKVKNQRYQFEGTYLQQEGIPLKGYKYVFYNSDGSVIKEYPIVYQQGGSLNQFVAFLENGKSYKVKLICIDQNDIYTSSDSIPFVVEYVPPRIRQLISLTNNKDTASIDIHCDIRQLIFKTMGETGFVDNAIDLTTVGAGVYMDDSFTLNRDFYIQMWLNGFGTEILHLKDTAGVIDNSFKVFYSEDDNRFHVVKTIDEITMEYISDTFAKDDSSSVTLVITQKGGRVDIIFEIVGETI